MRRTLGTAVFAGMLGVTLFGVFLTPVFYYVIQWFADNRAAAPIDGEVISVAKTMQTHEHNGQAAPAAQHPARGHGGHIE
jgi:hypothetical protein